MSHDTEEKPICCFKNDKDLVNFDPSTHPSTYLLWHWRAKFEENRLVVWKMTWAILQIFARTLESAKIGTFVGSFCTK